MQNDGAEGGWSCGALGRAKEVLRLWLLGISWGPDDASMGAVPL